MQAVLMKMKEHGCDVDGALNRMLNDEAFLLHCMRAALEQTEYDALGEALGKKDVKAAFEYAHALKGVTANVGLTPLYDSVVKIVEPLRAGNGDGLEPEYTHLIALKKEKREVVA